MGDFLSSAGEHRAQHGVKKGSVPRINAEELIISELRDPYGLLLPPCVIKGEPEFASHLPWKACLLPSLSCRPRRLVKFKTQMPVQSQLCVRPWRAPQGHLGIETATPGAAWLRSCRLSAQRRRDASWSTQPRCYVLPKRVHAMPLHDPPVSSSCICVGAAPAACRANRRY